MLWPKLNSSPASSPRSWKEGKIKLDISTPFLAALTLGRIHTTDVVYERTRGGPAKKAFPKARSCASAWPRPCCCCCFVVTAEKKVLLMKLSTIFGNFKYSVQLFPAPMSKTMSNRNSSSVSGSVSRSVCPMSGCLFEGKRINNQWRGAFLRLSKRDENKIKGRNKNVDNIVVSYEGPSERWEEFDWWWYVLLRSLKVRRSLQFPV